MPSFERIKQAILATNDETSFIQGLLIDTLQWPLDESAETIEDISYNWTAKDLQAEGLKQRLVDGRIRQLQPISGCPWGIFIIEFANSDVFSTSGGMTGPLRQILRGLVHRQRKASHLPSFHREHLLFICTHNYKYFRITHFRDPGEEYKTAPLASFGWGPGSVVKTVATYNLPNLTWPDQDIGVDAWTERWTEAFDVERVTKKFYGEYQDLHETILKNITGIKGESDRKWYASVLLNRLMFIYFLQKKGFLDKGDQDYLEGRLKDSKAKKKNNFFRGFLTLLFFEGFAKPESERTKAAIKALGDIRFLNGGLFLEHIIEQRVRDAGREINVPDSVFNAVFKLFASYSWNLNDTPGGQDNEINPDVLGYIFEKYINQKSFGAYYTPPQITGYLCERTIHRLILEGIRSPGNKGAALPKRDYASIQEMLRHMDEGLCRRLLNEVLPELALLDPACGSGAFLVAAMKTLIDIYAALYGWIEFNGGKELKAKLKKVRKDHPSVDYFIKKRIITDNLYGVDIMAEGCETARLRLFLALVAAAEEPVDLEPLPNIDFNILSGNSLFGLTHVDPNGFDQRNLYLPPFQEVLDKRSRLLDTYRHTTGYVEDLTVLRDEIREVNEQAQSVLDDMLLQDFIDLGIKFEQATWDVGKGKAGKVQKRVMEIDDIEALTPFHWGYQFDQVMARGGFDAIITNPPWDVFKPNGKEFFLEYSDLVTRKKMSIHDFQTHQKKLLKDKDIREAWLEYLSSFPYQSKYFRSSPEFVHQSAVVSGKKVGSDINLYKAFLERCFCLLRKNGQCGIVIPSGTYTDLGAKGLREMLFEKTQIDSLFCIENRRAVFEDVHRSFKFIILTFAKGNHTESFPAAFMRHDIRELEHFPQQGSLLIDVDLVHKLSPDSLSVMEFKSDMDVTIAKKMLHYPLLGEDVPGWPRIQFVREFDMTQGDASHLVFRYAGASREILYEGKLMWHFDHRFGKPQCWVQRKAMRKYLLGREADACQKINADYFRLVFRRQASNTNERTLVTTIIPPAFHADNLAGLNVAASNGQMDSILQLFLCAVLNSFTVDALVRQKVTTNLNFFYLYQLPVPRLKITSSGLTKVATLSARLICTTPEFDGLATAIVPGSSATTLGATEPVERAKLRAELDAMVAHLYGLTAEEFEHVLHTFPIVDQQIKDDVLAAYHAMVASGEAAKFNPDVTGPRGSDADQVVHDLIAAGESATVEFKSSARWDYRNSKQEKFIEQIIVKTVAAFLNSKGGTLLIGVNDDGDILGLDPDVKTLGKKQDIDGYELFLMNLLLKHFGKDAAAQLRLTFPCLDGKDICQIEVTPSPKPRFVIEAKTEYLYIRTGNSTNTLKPSEIYDYINERFARRLEAPSGSWPRSTK